MPEGWKKECLFRLTVYSFLLSRIMKFEFFMKDILLICNAFFFRYFLGIEIFSPFWLPFVKMERIEGTYFLVS